ncbi:hypothetical protein ACU5EH_00920 [Aliivibrio salmonicida]|uniref:hypothetical protein n=1 Tax=Aliivibrio salmonicida TaxID=40269 RepID=UPI00406C8FC1
MKDKLKRLALSWQPHKKCYFTTNNNEDCQGKIINAHTVQKSGGLKQIAQNGHVRYFKPSFKSLLDNNGKLTCEIEGVGKASTFYGFCQKHDREIFSPIENYSFNDSRFHALLHGYRAICKELYAKNDNIEFHKKTNEILKVEGLLSYSLKLERDGYIKGMELAVSELTELKDVLESYIQTKNSDNVNFLAIHTDEITEFMCCGAFIPEFTFDGKKLQTLFTVKELSSYLSVNIFSANSKGVILFQWIGENKEIIEFLSGLISSRSKDIPSLLTDAVFEFFENTFISPSWWNTLSTKEKKGIQNRVMSFGNNDIKTLTNRTIKVMDWNINSIVSSVDELEAKYSSI